MNGMADPGVWRRDGQFVLQVLRTHRLLRPFGHNNALFCARNLPIGRFGSPIIFFTAISPAPEHWSMMYCTKSGLQAI